MTIKIHHATQTKANKNGMTIKSTGDKFTAVDNEDGHILAVEDNPKKALEAAIERPLKRATNDGSSIVKGRYKKRYGSDAHCGDDLAVAINNMVRTSDGIDEDALQELARANDLDYSRWDHLNIGQRSMSIRNNLRGILRRAERPVVVGSQIFHPEVETKAA